MLVLEGGAERFVAVPLRLLADGELSIRARLLAALLLARTDPRTRTYTGGPADFADVGLGATRVVRAAMSELEAAGHVTRTRTRSGIVYRLDFAEAPPAA